jgi:hypothetical protein
MVTRIMCFGFDDLYSYRSISFSHVGRYPPGMNGAWKLRRILSLTIFLFSSHLQVCRMPCIIIDTAASIAMNDPEILRLYLHDSRAETMGSCDL